MSDSKSNQRVTYTVKVKNGAGWRSYDVARLHISVGQEYHEGEKFKATIDWMKDRFKRTVICVNDTLQRHNLETGNRDHKAAFDFAEVAGREWIERNISVIRTLPNYELKRWEEWRSDPRYNTEISRMYKTYEHDSTFRTQVDAEVSAFWERKQKRDTAVTEDDFEEFKKHSISYLLEECAVFQLMFARDHAVDVYPGSTLLPCKLHDIENLGERGYTRIDFSRNDPTSPDALNKMSLCN